MLTTKEFSEVTGVPVGTLKRWRSKPRGSCEGRQGVLVPAVVDAHGRCFYDESQLDIARQLHNPHYGQPTLFEEMTHMPTNETATADNAAQEAAQATIDAVDDQTPADVQNAATSDDSDVVTIDTQGEIVTLEQRAEKIRRLQANVQRGIIEIGNELIAAKNEIGHGNWTQWLKTEFQWTPRTAQNFMAIAERFGKNEIDFVFKPTTLIQMLALPVGSEDEFIAQQAESGKPVNKMSTREVKDAVKEFNQRKTVANENAESPTPNSAREVDSSPVEVQDEPPPAHVDDVQDSSGDATRNEINALLARVVELILDADDDALTVTKAGLAGIVAALKKNVARVKIDSVRKTIATDGISVCNPPKEA